MWVTKQEVEGWTRDFYTALTNADGNRSFVDCLNAANQNQQNEEFRSILRAIRDVVALGYPLSKAMALHPDVFDANYIAVVRYGEMYGELDLTLERFIERPEERAPHCQRPASD